MPSRLQLFLERLLAYAVVISPPIAGAATLILLIRHRGRLGRLRREPWTLGVFALLAGLGLISTLLAESSRTAMQGPLGLLGLFVAWLVGTITIDHPRRFWRDLQRGVAVIAVLTVAWILRPFTVRFAIGGLVVPLVVPHDPVAVFGLGANGLGPLLVYGAVLALGRLLERGQVHERIEAFAISSAALVAAFVIGVRGTVLGALTGAVALTFSTGPAGALVIALITVTTTLILLAFRTTAGPVHFRPELWASLLDLTSAAQRKKIWASALRMVSDHPWFGVGPFHFVHANARYMAGDPEVALRLGPHSIYLRMLAEWGIPATAVLVTWLFSWPVRLWEHRAEMWRWSFVAGLLSFLVMGVLDDPLFTMHVSAAVFMGIGLAASELAGSRSSTV